MDDAKVEIEKDTTDRILPGRCVPQWVRVAIWVVGAVWFPMGIFICLALAKALRWWVAILFAAGSVGLWYALTDMGEFGTTAVVWFCLAAGQFQYHIGQRHGLWSRGAKRVWKAFGWVGLALAIVNAMMAYLHFQIPPEYRH